jgi:hypothetical protein
MFGEVMSWNSASHYICFVSYNTAWCCRTVRCNKVQDGSQNCALSLVIALWPEHLNNYALFCAAVRDLNPFSKTPCLVLWPPSLLFSQYSAPSLVAQLLVKLATHPCWVLRLRINGSVPPFHMSLQCAQGRLYVIHNCRNFYFVSNPWLHTVISCTKNSAHTAVCQVTVCHVAVCHVTVCHVAVCHVAVCHVTVCHVSVSCHRMSCHCVSCRRVSCHCMWMVPHVYVNGWVMQLLRLLSWHWQGAGLGDSEFIS